MDPTIDLKQNPTNDFQKWAVGTVFKTVHQGANVLAMLQLLKTMKLVMKW